MAERKSGSLRYKALRSDWGLAPMAADNMGRVIALRALASIRKLLSNNIDYFASLIRSFCEL